MRKGNAGMNGDLAGLLRTVYSLLLLEEDEAIRASYWDSADLLQAKITKEKGKREAIRIARRSFEMAEKDVVG